MANVNFQAVGKGGHFAKVNHAARSREVYSLQNASYNGVKIYPSLLFINNSSNDGVLILTASDGLSYTIPARANYRLELTDRNNFDLAITNAGHSAAALYFFDREAGSVSDVTLALNSASGSVEAIDMLFHFNAAPGDKGEGLEPQSNYTITTGGSIVSTGKFGIGSLRLAFGQIWRTNDNGFFEQGKDFVVDFWKLTPAAEMGANQMIFALAEPGTERVRLITNAVSTRLTLIVDGNSSIGLDAVIVPDVWQFFRIVKESGVYKVLVDGVIVLQSSAVYNAALSILYLGGGLLPTHQGYYDELRYSKGIRLDNIYDVPTGPYYI